MKLVEFPEQTIVVAKDQPQYNSLPAHRVANDPRGTLICCWKVPWWERLAILITGRIWHQVLTFNEPLQPQLLLAEKPDMDMVVDEKERSEE